LGNLEKLPLSLTNSAFTYWAKDSNLIFESVESPFEITKVSVENLATTVLLESNRGFIWTTDENGDFYYLQETESSSLSDANYTEYSLYAVNANGEQQAILPSIFTIFTNEFIDVDDISELQTPFKNSSQNTRFAGSIIDFHIDNNNKNFIFETDFAIYRYDIETKMFTLMDNQTGHYIATDEDETQMLYSTNDGLNIFIYDKEEADPITQLGSHTLVDYAELRQQYPSVLENKDNVYSLGWAFFDNWDQNIIFEYGGNVFHVDIYGSNLDVVDNETDTYYWLLGENSDELFNIDMDVSEIFYTLYRYDLR
jgi:hypothetical protein